MDADIYQMTISRSNINPFKRYLEYLHAAENMDMEIAGEFIVMASELMLIKSRMLLPRAPEEEDDPRADLADALRRYQQAKQAAVKMAELYKIYSGRMAKDTDEVSVDPTYVADQEVTSLALAVRRIIAANESRPKLEKTVFAPMIAKPIIPVEIKIVGILHRMEKKPAGKTTTMRELLSDATSLPDLIAIFLGGLVYALYPIMTGLTLMHEARTVSENFIRTLPYSQPYAAESPSDTDDDATDEMPAGTPYPELLAAMKAYNERIYAEGQVLL